MLMLDRNLLKSHLYSTFVLPQMTEQNNMIHAIEVEVIHGTIITIKKIIHNKNTISQNRYCSTFSKDNVDECCRTKVLLLHNTLDHDMTTINEIHDHIALLTDLLTDPLTDMTHVKDTNHARIQEITTISQDIHLHIDHLLDQEILDFPVNFEVHMYHPTEMASAVTPTIWFYSLYTHTPRNQIQRDYPSRLEISFILDSGASISVLHYPPMLLLQNPYILNKTILSIPQKL